MDGIDLRVIEQKEPVIKINFDEIKESLKATVSEYSNLIVTEDNLSLCKGKQKELAGMRTKIEDYRKTVKKAMSAPIEAFEANCKELVKLVEDAEAPIKENIKVFDDLKREAKKQEAQKVIDSMITEHGLKPKYASQLGVLEKYCNLTAKTSDVKEDIEQRTFLLVEQQRKEDDDLLLIQDTITNVNKGIKRQLTITEFQWMLDKQMSTRDIIAAINKNADQIREAENPKPTEPQQAATIPAAEPALPTPPQSAALEKQYYVLLLIEGTKPMIEAIAKYISQAGGKYEVKEQGRL